MIRLASTSERLYLSLGTDAVTNECQIVTGYQDKTSTDYTGGNKTLNSTGATIAQIVDPPAASTIRDIDFISVYNADTIVHTVTIQFHNGSTHILIKVDLIPGATLTYTHGQGWQVMNSGVPPVSNANMLDNGCCRISQRGTSFTGSSPFVRADGGYILDRYIMLYNTANVTVTQELESSNNLNFMRFSVGGTATEFGVMQLLSKAMTQTLQHPKASSPKGFVSAGVDIRTPSGIPSARLYLLGWTGTADSPSKDPISAWNGIGSLPTLGANWTVLAAKTFTMGPNTVTDELGFHRYVLENVEVSAAYNNLAFLIVFFNVTANQAADLTHFKLENSRFATPFQYKNWVEEYNNCCHYTFVLGGTNNRLTATGMVWDTSTVYWTYPAPVMMRKEPKLTLVGTGTFSCHDGNAGSTTTIASAFSSTKIAIGANFVATSGSPYTNGRSAYGFFSDTTTYLHADADLGV